HLLDCSRPGLFNRQRRADQHVRLGDLVDRSRDELRIAGVDCVMEASEGRLVACFLGGRHLAPPQSRSTLGERRPPGTARPWMVGRVVATASGWGSGCLSGQLTADEIADPLPGYLPGDGVDTV